LLTTTFIFSARGGIVHSNVTEGRGNGGGLREICPEMHDGAWARRELFRVKALLTTNLDPKDSNVTEGRGNGGGLREICPEMHDGGWTV
jgi:hypothetical protein